MSVQQPAGWQPDPLGTHQRRWWDGQSWTDHVHDDVSQPALPPPPADLAPYRTAAESTIAPPSAAAAPVPAGPAAMPPPGAVRPSAPGGYLGNPASAGLSAEEIQWARLSHLLCLLGYLLPIVHIAFPVVIWLTRGKESAFVTAHAKEALNFQICITIYLFIAGILTVVLIGWVLALAIIVVDVVSILRATGAAGRGHPFRYPITIRFAR